MAGNHSVVKVYIDYVVKKLNGRNGEMVALNGVDMDIHENEFICVVSPSGCGKSILLNIISGLETPTKGKALVDGAEVTDPGPDHGIVFQQYVLFPWFTVEKNVQLGLKLQGKSKEEAEELAHKYLKMVDLEGFAKAYPKEPLGGMKQHVAIAHAHAASPRVLLMNEPFGALDVQTRTQPQQELLNTREKEQKTCFFITRDVEEVTVLARWVVIMCARPGRVKEIVDIDIPYPRDQETKMSPRFLKLKSRIWSQVYQEYLSVRK